MHGPRDFGKNVSHMASISHMYVTTNIAPKHYGVAATVIFNPLADAGEADKKYYDELEGVWRVRKMTWYIKKGDDLHCSRKIEFPFYSAWDHEPSAGGLQLESQLMECSKEAAPAYPRAGKRCFLSIIISHRHANDFADTADDKMWSRGTVL